MKNAVLLFLSFSAIVCYSQTNSGFTIGPDEFEKGITQKKIQLLDVRTTDEFNKGHIENALQADWTNKEQFFHRVTFVDKDKPVYIYCLSGGRSNAAANWMRNNGFHLVIELKGGILSWEKAGKKTLGQTKEKQITLKEFMASIPADKITLVDFGADWCPPCIKMKPVIQDIVSRNPQIHFMQIDAGSQSALMDSMNISSIPGFIIYKNGIEVWRKEGIVTKWEFLNQLK